MSAPAWLEYRDRLAALAALADAITLCSTPS